MTDNISMINVKGTQIGIIGLIEILEEVKAMQLQEECEIKKNLLKRAKYQNYIPKSQEEDYGRSLCNEYRKSLGLSVEEESLQGMLSIRILGPGCYACNKMEKHSKDVVAELGVAANIQHIRGLNEIAKYGPGLYPAFIINNKAYSSGKAAPRQQLRKWLEELIRII